MSRKQTNVKYLIEAGDFSSHVSKCVDDLDEAKGLVLVDLNKWRLYHELPEATLDQLDFTGPHPADGFSYYSIPSLVGKYSASGYYGARIIVIDTESGDA